MNVQQVFEETFGGIHKKYDIEPDMAVFYCKKPWQWIPVEFHGNGGNG